MKPTRLDWPRAWASLRRRPWLLVALALTLAALLLGGGAPAWALAAPALLVGLALGLAGRAPRAGTAASRLDVGAPADEALAPDARDAVIEGLRVALGASHLALYRADPPEPGYRLVAGSCREGRARARLHPGEGIVPLLARSATGQVRLPGADLRPMQVPLVGVARLEGAVLLRGFDADGARGLWFVADAPPDGDPRLGALDRTQAALLTLDAVLRRANSLATWNQVLGILVRYATSLHGLDSPEAAVRHAGDLLERVLGEHRLGVLEIAGERGGTIRRVALHPAEPWPDEWPQSEALPKEGFGPLIGLDARARAESLLPDEAGAWFAREGAWYVEGVVPSPLLRLVFVLHVGDARAVGSAEVRAVVGLALRQTAEHLHDLVVIERLRGFAIVDALTGAYNKRYFQSRLAEEVRRTRRHGIPFALVLVDLDHFKRVNDTHGHDAGDAVLRQVGETLREAVRGDDVAARYGGEEFAILLVGTEREGAAIFAERLRAAIAGLRIPWRDGHLPVSASLGVTVCVDPHGTPELVFKAADEALYRAKRGGRNRVEIG